MAPRKISARVGVIDLLAGRYGPDDPYARPPSRWALAAPRVLVAVAVALAVMALLAAALAARGVSVTLMVAAVGLLPLAALVWWSNRLHWRRYLERRTARPG
jgi:hypothetical protein